MAEPRDAHREKAQREFGVADGDARPDWGELAARPKFADAVVIANPDAGHRDAAVAHIDFATARTVTTPVGGGGVHGGDGALVNDFLDAVATGDPSRLLTGPAETLETHLTVSAAEKARREGRVVALGEDLDG